MKSRRGFTLIQIMIVVLAIALVLSYVIPMAMEARKAARAREVARVREAANKQDCLTNLSNLDAGGVKYVWDHTSNKIRTVPKPEMDVVVKKYLGGHKPVCKSGGEYSFVHPVVDGEELMVWFPACKRHGVYNPLTGKFM